MTTGFDKPSYMLPFVLTGVIALFSWHFRVDRTPYCQAWLCRVCIGGDFLCPGFGCSALASVERKPV